MGLGKGLALSAIVAARVTAGRDVSESWGDISRRSQMLEARQTYFELTFPLLPLFQFELEMVPVRGYAKGCNVRFSGFA
jgi:hypothetical protein